MSTSVLVRSRTTKDKSSKSSKHESRQARMQQRSRPVTIAVQSPPDSPTGGGGGPGGKMRSLSTPVSPVPRPDPLGGVGMHMGGNGAGGGGDTGSCRRGTLRHFHSVDEENRHLQEMLSQSWQREAEALRRLHHLSSVMERQQTIFVGDHVEDSLAMGGPQQLQQQQRVKIVLPSADATCTSAENSNSISSPPTFHETDIDAVHPEHFYFNSDNTEGGLTSVPVIMVHQNASTDNNVSSDFAYGADSTTFVENHNHTHTQHGTAFDPKTTKSLPAGVNLKQYRATEKEELEMLNGLSSASGKLSPTPQGLKDYHMERERPPSSMEEREASRLLRSQTLNSRRRSLSLDRIDIAARGGFASSFSVTSSSHVPLKEVEKPVSQKRHRTSSILRLRRGLSRLRKHGHSSGGGGSHSNSSSNPSSSSFFTSNSSNKTFDQLFTNFLLSSSTHHVEPLAQYLGQHWTSVCGVLSEGVEREEVKRRDAVWELFQEECKYLTRQLRPLEQIYKGFLEELHFHRILQVADTHKIFANLSELCELTSSVACDLFQLFKDRPSATIATTNELVLAFSMFGHKFNPIYQQFCANLERQRGFLKALEQQPDFQEYSRVCRGCDLVQKNDLVSLLIAPMQHQCHYQLLLEKTLKHTKDPNDCAVLSSTIKAFVVSLKELESNITEHKRSVELLELQETVCWPSLSQLDPDAYIPPEVQQELEKDPHHCVLATKDRQLLHKGSLKLLDYKLKSTELDVFLFSDFLLMTEQRKHTSKRTLIQYTVHRHPLLLSLLEIHDVQNLPAYKNLICLVERSPLQHCTGVYTLQAYSRAAKVTWLKELRQAKGESSVGVGVVASSAATCTHHHTSSPVHHMRCISEPDVKHFSVATNCSVNVNVVKKEESYL